MASRLPKGLRRERKDLGVKIVSGVLSREHVHMLVEIPPHIALSDFLRTLITSGTEESPELRKRYWGGISGLGAPSPSRAATSRTMSYFSIFRSTNLPASGGRYSVTIK
jgi:putative transposase